jgi:HlyD family secretion protein/epimerase transport system membrane fusion protein
VTANPDLKVSSPRGWIVAGLLVVLVTFGGLGTWATLMPLAGAVIAPGVVTVQSNRKTVQHLEGGIVTQILVRDGDVVETGELLIQLDRTRAQASVSILGGELDLLRSREARLLAERDGRPEIAFPPALAARAREDANVAELVRGQRLLFEARRASLDGESELLVQRVGQYEDEIAGLQQQSLSKDRQIEIVEDELEGLHALYERGFESRRRINELERLAEELRGELGAHTTAIAFDVSERQVAASDRMTRLEIRAPQSGIVVGMRAHTVGGVIGPGEPVLDIVPAGDELVIEARMRPEDIDKVRVGQTAIVRLSAFDQRTTPELEGTVISTSADRVVDETTGAAFFLVRSRISEGELEKLAELQLVPGMPAETFVQTGSRTVLSYLLKPFSDGVARALREG